MAFAVNVGADLFGTKRNIKLEFPSVPSMSDFINAVESQYDVMLRANRPAGYPDIPFKVQTFQLYDDVLQRWVDLYSSAQLTSGATVYCFQPESVWHSDSQGIIPDAAQNVTWTTPVGSPRRARVASDAGVAPTLSEKLRSVFYDCDAGNKGYVLYSDLKAAFAKCDIEFTYATVGELFTAADANKSGHITYDEWVSFAIKYPAIVDAMFFRARDLKQDQTQALAASAAAADAAAQAQRQAELRAMYERQQWQPPPPRSPVQEQEAAVEAQKAAATAAAARLAEMQQAAEAQRAAGDGAQQRVQGVEAEVAAAEQEVMRTRQAAAEAAQALEDAKAVAIGEAQKEAQAQAYYDQLKKQEAAAAAREAAATHAATSAAAAEAQQRAQAAAAHAAAAEAQKRAQAEAEQRMAADAAAAYEQARKEADAARIAKELAESRERTAWDQLYYSPASPPRV